MLFSSVIAAGCPTGVPAPLVHAPVADQFGLALSGRVRLLMAPRMAAAGAVANQLAGVVYDLTGGYGLLFRLIVGSELVAATAMKFSARSRETRFLPEGRVT